MHRSFPATGVEGVQDNDLFFFIHRHTFGHDAERSSVCQGDDHGTCGDDAADGLRCLVVTKSRTITQRQLRGL